MKRLALLALLLSASLGAQTVDSNELTYGPFAPGPRDASFSVAVAPHGMLLAWSEADPDTGLASIHTGLLNHEAQLIGSIHTIAPANANRSATTPVVATNGESFFVAWVERDAYTYAPHGVAGVLTDASGRPVEASRGMGPPPRPNAAPALVWDGIGYRVHDATRRVPFATPEANGWVDWSDDCVWCRFHSARYQLDWTVITPEWIRTGSTFDFDYASPAPAVTATGNDLLIVWSTNSGLKAFRVIDGRADDAFFLHSRDAAGSAPSMAGSLVVFAQGGDVFGSIVTGDTFGAPFPISTGPELDKLPRVYAVGDNRYLVTYIRETHPSAVSLVGRFVNTP